ncbi:phospholipase A2 inhibitor-like [Perca flavescens]|uniref:phospholipase A2 inhibitor-like n=1 Tax=Perca flavescens TaxID=8167 RepID=UPI00106EAEDD|nr:phospholipase A2 inhibitor-like [Perca flavescens]
MPTAKLAMLSLKTYSGEAAFMYLWSSVGGPRQKHGKKVITRPPELSKLTLGRVQAVRLHPASITSVTMKVAVGLVLMLLNVHLSQSCSEEGNILICFAIPPGFSPGYSTLVMFLKDVGEINSAVFRSNNLASITRLRIDNAGVTGIAEGAFSSFQNLKSLSLNHNLLTEINPNWFGRPDILSDLSLTDNQIKVLNPSMLNGLLNLTRLSLNKNTIRTIDLNSFSSNTILTELDLSENRMTRVSPQVFRSLRSTEIRLDGNPWDCSCGGEDFVDFLKGL